MSNCQHILVTSGCCVHSHVSSETVSELTLLLDELDDHNVQMSDCLKLMTHVSAPHQVTERLCAPHTLGLLQWTWAVKVHPLISL